METKEFNSENSKLSESEFSELKNGGELKNKWRHKNLIQRILKFCEF
jgi:hypothetical protein